MIDSDHYLGEVLDEKYRLERLLGRGGMGAVYLATHLGTERYVALKLITPQFMRNEEFVARFKREARAAGRLRHPNVVDVTDFGFAHAGGETVAYLVMEYLDGCTLGDILTEEKQLPLEWVVDILEQVCSAVHEAHQQGVVHRDLKPENIWLEPNRLGGYRVKVLDFGIAKLAETDPSPDSAGNLPGAGAPKLETHIPRDGTIAAGPQLTSLEGRQFDSEQQSPVPGRGGVDIATLLLPSESEDQGFPEKRDAEVSMSRAGAEDDTQIFELEAEGGLATTVEATSDSPNQADDDQTLMFDQAHTEAAAAARLTKLHPNTTQGTELTRVGAIMGTPLYMSPEQCSAKSLDARSDIYSLGVIAYQMLAGEPPFNGVTSSVMRSHIEAEPPHLRGRVKKLPKRAARVVMDALAKDPADRPQTAAAFANSLRAEAEGIGALYRRAFALYSEYFPKFLKLSLIAHLPVMVMVVLSITLELLQKPLWNSGIGGQVVVVTLEIVFGLLQMAAYFVAASAISGVTAVIVTQLAVAPLQPVELRIGFGVLKNRWRAFLNTTIRVTLRQIIGFVLLIVPGIVVTIRYGLYAPVVLMEGLEKKAALRRARELASRSWRTVIVIMLLQMMLPMVVSALIGRIGFRETGEGASASIQTAKQANGGTGVELSTGKGLQVTTDQAQPRKAEKGLHISTSSSSMEIYQELSGLINIFLIPLAAIVSALLYLKMRQLGGE
ncbi:MAG TPA: serine/threonine-protein kinase, partial [Pyrinomonadaceae bacterium]|nr:serine/threonine-protein kinase [Pyrinomonadaceae bacterium]